MFDNKDLTAEMPKLEKFAYKLARNSHDAHDLLQSTLLRAIEKKHLFNEGTNLFSWTSKIMYNLFVSGYRRKVKFESQYDPENHIKNQSVDPDQDTKMELINVREAMKTLSKQHREVLTMVCIKGMPYDQTSKALDIPVGTVRSRLSRAREQLNTCLEQPKVRTHANDLNMYAVAA